LCLRDGTDYSGIRGLTAWIAVRARSDWPVRCRGKPGIVAILIDSPHEMLVVASCEHHDRHNEHFLHGLVSF